MQAFIDTVNKAVASSLQTTIKNYINEFATVLVKKINEEEKEWKVDEIVSIWNKLATDFVVKKNSKKGSEKKDDNSKCEHMFTKGPKNGTQCSSCVSDKSTTKKYCVKHYKSNEKEEKSNEKGEEKFCCYIIKKGHNNGDECGKNISKNSKTGNYCSKHIKEEGESKKFNKVEFIENIKEKINAMEDEDEDELSEILNSVVKEFGFISVYNLEKISPKIYKEYQETIDEFIEENREKNGSLIKEYEEEEIKKEEKKKEKKGSSKKSKGGDKKEKKDKKGSSKKSKGDDDKEEKKDKKGSSKKSKEDDDKEEKKGSKKSKGDNKVKENTEINEEKEEIEVLKVKKYNTPGELKTMMSSEKLKYFEDKQKKINYIFDPETEIVSGKIINNKKVELDEEDKLRITKYWTLKVNDDEEVNDNDEEVNDDDEEVNEEN
jgi:hypothetical protein